MIFRKLIFAGLLVCCVISTGFSQFSEQSLKFGEVFDKISKYYVDTINENKFLEEVIVQMLHDLDPHSSYLSREEVKAMQEPLDGNFEGIGVSFNILGDTIFIINPIPGGPSEKLGILAGDRIIKIDGENVAGIKITNLGVQKRLKGKKGTKVNVSIQRRGVSNLIDFVITRDEIPMYSIDASYMVDGETGYIKLSRFSMTSLNEYFDAMIKLQKQGLKNLILDLCGNGGGYLKVAVDLADQFISGKKMLVYTEGLQNPRRNYYSTGAGQFQDGKLIVMIDELSASASEIVAGALQDLDRAVIIGRRSFGKGLVQQPFQLSDGSLIRLTVAKYYTPTGRLIQKPYYEGFDAYSKELLNRENKGELYTFDPISFPDSLKYNTLTLNRIVYGGGGIMPDYIVPSDTSFLSNYYKNLIRQGVFNQFILNYEDNHRKELNSKYSSFSKFDSDFKVSNEIIQQLIKYAENQGIKFNKEDFEISKEQLNVLIKAYFARDLWSWTEFYRVYNQKDPVYLKSVEVMKNTDLYAKKLQTYHEK